MVIVPVSVMSLSLIKHKILERGEEVGNRLASLLLIGSFSQDDDALCYVFHLFPQGELLWPMVIKGNSFLYGELDMSNSGPS